MDRDIKSSVGLGVSQDLSKNSRIGCEIGAIVRSFDVSQVLSRPDEVAEKLCLGVFVANETALSNGSRIVVARTDCREGQTSPVGASKDHVDVLCGHFLSNVVTIEDIDPVRTSSASTASSGTRPRVVRASLKFSKKTRHGGGGLLEVRVIVVESEIRNVAIGTRAFGRVAAPA